MFNRCSDATVQSLLGLLNLDAPCFTETIFPRARTARRFLYPKTGDVRLDERE